MAKASGQRSAGVYVMRQTDRQADRHNPVVCMCACLTACLSAPRVFVCLPVCLPCARQTDRQTCAHTDNRGTRGKCTVSCLRHLNVDRPPLRAICGLQPFCPAQVLELDALPSVQPCLEDELGGGGQGALQPVVVQRTGLPHCHPLCKHTS